MYLGDFFIVEQSVLRSNETKVVSNNEADHILWNGAEDPAYCPSKTRSFVNDDFAKISRSGDRLGLLIGDGNWDDHVCLDSGSRGR